MTVDKMDTGETPVSDKDIYSEFDTGMPVKEGETWYLVSTKWINKWKSYAGIGISGDNGEHPGPIDNSGLLEDNSAGLRQHLMEKAEYELMPESAWKKLIDKYNLVEGQDPISRKTISWGTYQKMTTVEIYLPIISLKQHDGDGQIIKEPFSRAALLSDVHSKMKELFEIPDNITTRVYIADSVDAVNESHNLDDAGVGPDQVLVLEKQNEDGTWPRSTLTTSNPPSYQEATSSPSTSMSIKPKSSNTSYNSYNGSSYSTRSTSSYWSSSRVEEPGLCGLSNLGNTCFMNSAIQCLSNVPPLTMYFRDDTFEEDINETNPIGMHGKLAKAYASLIKDIWSGKNSSVAPREFKLNVSKFAPQFTGYQQHDSQELLAFLIDGLHEDLNRITQKPYVELKDSGGRHDFVVSQEAWKNHRARNDSIIVDMFHGLFKSTIVCPDCPKVSVTFDPFGFLSLPLPKARDMSVICNFVPRDSKKMVSRHNLSLPKDGCMKDLCKALAEKMGCKAKHLVVTDVYNHRFYKIYKGSERLSSYSDRDDLYVFQLGFDEDDEKEHSELEYAKVFMRQNSGNVSTMRLFAHPFLIPVKSGETTYRKFYNSVLAAVSRYVKQEFRDDVKMLSEMKKIDMNESVGSDVDGGDIGDNSKEEEQNDQNNVEEETKWFSLVSVNSFGSTILQDLKDDEKPIRFTGDVYFSAEWDNKICGEYAVEDWSKTFEMDVSMSEKPVKAKAVSLQQCMKLFTTKEKLGAHDLWYCPSCKDHKQATKKFDLWALPPVLIIHLKRFSYTRWSRDKISTYVEFPTKDLDLSEFIINPSKEEWEPKKKKYNLIGVSNHYGGMGGGHYTAYALNYRQNKWYYFDDSSVTESSEDRVQTKAAYMLMYQRQDMEDWIKAGGKEQFNFLESMVSPRGCNERFDFEHEKEQEKHFQNGDENLSNQEDMDTS